MGTLFSRCLQWCSFDRRQSANHHNGPWSRDSHVRQSTSSKSSVTSSSSSLCLKPFTRQKRRTTSNDLPSRCTSANFDQDSINSQKRLLLPTSCNSTDFRQPVMYSHNDPTRETYFGHQNSHSLSAPQHSAGAGGASSPSSMRMPLLSASSSMSSAPHCRRPLAWLTHHHAGATSSFESSSSPAADPPSPAGYADDERHAINNVGSAPLSLRRTLSQRISAAAATVMPGEQLNTANLAVLGTRRTKLHPSRH